MMQGLQFNQPALEGVCDISTLIYGDHKQLARQLKTRAAKRPRGKSNFFLALLFGFMAAAFGSLVWSTISILTGCPLSWLSLMVALLVGLAMRSFGNGAIQFCILGAILVFLACLSSDVITTCDAIARNEGVRLLSVIKSIDGDFIMHVLESMLKHTLAARLLYIISIALGFAASMKLRPH